MADLRDRLTQRIRTLRDRAQQLTGEAQTLRAKANELELVRDGLTDLELAKLDVLKANEIVTLAD